MSQKHFVIGSGDLSPKFTHRDAPAELGPVAQYILKLTGKPRPKFCYIGTAAGDEQLMIERFYKACEGHDVEAGHLQLFKKPNHDDIRQFILAQDAIWVAGGSTANLLAVWKVHGLQQILLEAQAQGAVIGGYSAGCVCWSLGGTTDSFGDTPRLLVNKDGAVPYSVCVHYDNEPERRPLYLQLIENGDIPAGYATDEGVSVHFVDGRPFKYITDTPGQAAYYVYKGENGKAAEDKIEPELIS